MSRAPEDVKRIAIVGTGVIGSGWAAVFAANGYTVSAYVRSAESEAKFKRFLTAAWHKVHMRGMTSDPEGWHAVQCVRTIADCVASADYVQESVVEELPLKQAIIAEIDQHAPAGVMVGTSSSFIPLSLVRARASRHPDRIATAHPTLPQWDAFVEVTPLPFLEVGRGLRSRNQILPPCRCSVRRQRTRHGSLNFSALLAWAWRTSSP